MTRSTRKKIARITLTGTLAVALGMGLACSKAPPDKPKAARTGDAGQRIVTLDAGRMKAAGIQIITVREVLPVREVGLTGSAAYDETRTARISSRISGRVLTLLKDFGSHVRRGDVLCILDSPDLGEAQAEYLSRLAEYRVVKKSAQRARRLVEQKAISQGEYLERDGALLRAEATLAFAENRLHLFDMGEEGIRRLRESLRNDPALHGVVSPKLAVRSPIDGTVTRLEVSTGEVVDRLQTLLVVSDLSRMWAWLDVYEKDLGSVRRGQPVEIEPQALPGTVFRGEIDFIGEVEPRTRAARVRVRLANPERRLLPGMFVRATLHVPALKEALVVPREAVQQLEGRKVVFLETGEGRFCPVDVRLGEAFDGQVEIAGGLSNGDRIAARGAFTLKGELLKEQLGEEE
ncbi:MAG: efflux RND transporter periplasmic adaptor subunit [Acidobacteria bacterium]|nr:efflux RND transporter periplasmic adaptor subunit [Acidobacteriota bacterium]